MVRTELSQEVREIPRSFVLYFFAFSFSMLPPLSPKPNQERKQRKVADAYILLLIQEETDI